MPTKRLPTKSWFSPKLLGVAIAIGLLLFGYVLTTTANPNQPIGEAVQQPRQESSFPATADTYVTSGKPDESHGSLRKFWVGRNDSDGSGSQRALLRFDVAQIPAGSAITSAQLSLYMSAATTNDSPMPITVHNLNGPWDENINWNSHGSLLGAPTSATTSVDANLGSKSWDITSLVQQWLNNPAGNFGLILIGDESQTQRERGFWSKDCDPSECASRFPELVIQWEAPTPTPTATATNTATPTHTPTNTPTPTATPTPTQVPLKLSLAAEPAGEVGRGDTIVYTISYTNTGSAPLEGVSIMGGIPTDTSFDIAADPPDGQQNSQISWSVGNLAANSSQTKVYSVVVDQLAASQTSQQAAPKPVTAHDPLSDPALVANRAPSAASHVTLSDRSLTSAALEQDPKPGNDRATSQSAIEATPERTDADLQVKKQANKEFVRAGDRLTYTITISNTGPQDATNVVLSDTLPMNVTLDTSSLQEPCQALNNPSRVVCLFDQLLNGEQVSRDFAVTVSADAQGTITNSVTVGAPEYDPNLENNRATSQTQVESPVSTTDGDLEVKKEANKEFVRAGDRLIYSITISNTGPQDATNVVLSDTLPANVTLDTTTLEAGCQNNSGVVGCAFDQLANGEQVSRDFAVTVSPNARGMIANTVEVVVFDLHPENNRSTVTTRTGMIIANMVRASYTGADGQPFRVNSNMVFNGEPLKIYMPIMAR